MERTYNVKCKYCGTINHHLYLEETKGWMECECCGKAYQCDKSFEPVRRLPLIDARFIRAAKFAS